MNFEIFLSIILGISLAAAAGFRVFVPLFVVSIFAYLGWFEISSSWQWLGSTTALMILGVATVIEIISYLIPWVDNALDTIAVPLAGIAGTLLMGVTLGNMDPILTWSLAIIAGGGTAAAISGSTAVTRMGSTATTGGLANPIVSTTETVAATTISAMSLLSPILGVISVIILFWLLKKLVQKIRKG